MKELIGYEIKKILMRRVNQIAMLFGLILIIFSNLALIHSESFPVSDTKYCTGREAFQKQAKAENALTTQLSEDFLTGFLQDYQQALLTNAVTLREQAYCKKAESSAPAESPCPAWKRKTHPCQNSGFLFLPSSKTSWLWNHIFCLLPLHCFNLKDLLKMYISYPLGKIVISHLGMVLFSYALLSLLCILCTGRFFRKHQVGR